jgi:hypothetical protein
MSDMIYALNIPPGIQRDGTVFAAQTWVNGEWVRFQRKLVQKIGGYQEITHNENIVRGIYVLPTTPNFNIYMGTESDLTYVTIDQDATFIGGPVDRTPGSFITDVNNDWQFDVMFSTISDSNLLIAHAAPNLASIDNNVNRPVFYGPSEETTPLIPTGFSVSGGIVVLHPYLFMFGNDGNVIISNANDPTTSLIDGARVTGEKIVAGLATRGGTNSPAGLLWSLDSLIRVTFVGGAAIFNFDTVTNESSLLSSRGIIEYDGVYYWAAVDRFLMYGGQVLEVPNNASINFFFKNINYAQRQKVFATKVTQFGEIWWHFPLGNSVENNWALIYSIREQVWYDTPITRTDGFFDSTFAKPIWADNTPDGTGNYPIWVHEVGTDSVDSLGKHTAINSFVTSPDLSQCATGVDGNRASLDRWTELYRIEPDFLQTGNLNVTVTTKQYANSPNVVGPNNPYLITPETEKIDMREQGRLLNITFTSNEVGGYFEMGQILVVGRIGDVRQ